MVRRKGSVRSTTSRQSEAGNTSTNRTKVLVGGNKTRRRKNKIEREIKLLRKATKLIIPKAPFARLVRELMHMVSPRSDINRVQMSALLALQEAVEMYLVQFFEDAYLITGHAKRVTLFRNDMILLRRLRGRDDVINR